MTRSLIFGNLNATGPEVGHERRQYAAGPRHRRRQDPEIAATAMKMKQAGLVKKPLHVVPNHLLEQFAREFQQLYPNAKLLVAGKEDFTQGTPQASDRQDRQRRVGRHHRHAQLLRAHRHVAGLPGEVPEGADRGIQPAAPRRRQQEATRAHRNLIKTIEKQKAAREERLKDLLAEDKKDDGLVFDELGVDHIFIDEAHYFKNLETPTKMERVAGIQTGGSERAFDLYMKARYLRPAAPRPRRDVCHRHADLQHDGRDVHDAALPRSRGA